MSHIIFTFSGDPGAFEISSLRVPSRATISVFVLLQNFPATLELVVWRLPGRWIKKPTLPLIVP